MAAAESNRSSGTIDALTYVRAIAPYQGGKPIEELAREYGLQPDAIVKLASTDDITAAIAGEAAASRYALLPVASNIQDDPANRTRFVVLGRQSTQPSGKDKTSLILAVANRAGAVHHMLAPLAQHGVSMTRFESLPAKTGAWEYYFYVDVEGHESDPKVAQALAKLRGECAFYKSLGSYPAAV